MIKLIVSDIDGTLLPYGQSELDIEPVSYTHLKMVQTGILDTFIPKDWAEANGTTAEEWRCV